MTLVLQFVVSVEILQVSNTLLSCNFFGLVVKFGIDADADTTFSIFIFSMPQYL